MEKEKHTRHRRESGNAGGCCPRRILPRGHGRRVRRRPPRRELLGFRQRLLRHQGRYSTYKDAAVSIDVTLGCDLNLEVTYMSLPWLWQPVNEAG